jgi:F-type H+-transporting ATPase subunit b
MRARSGEWSFAYAQDKRVTSGEGRGRKAVIFASALCASLFFALSAHAAEEGGAAGAETATEIFKWINFAIVAGAIVWLCVKKAPGFFRGRAEAIGSAIAKAGSAKAAADTQLGEAENRLANLPKEVAELRAFARRESAAEVERIHAATRSDLEKIAAAAKAEIEAAERAARLELKALAAKLAVEGAESLLVKQLTAQTQAALISNFVKSLEGRPN